jgi:hypothetical protein
MNFFETGPHLPFQGKKESASSDCPVWMAELRAEQTRDSSPNGASVRTTSEFMEPAVAGMRKI